MSVTRYGINAQGVFTNLTDGGYVSYQDYEKLAAENAGLKDLARGWANATDDRLFEEHGEIFHDSIDACEEELKTICPNTDAFLAEVRAQGVEMAVDVVKQCYDNICAGGLQENREYEESIVQPHLDGIDDELKEIIDQLRKGVQS